MKQIPLYKHDCPRCVFLGQYEHLYDLYFCDQGALGNYGTMPTVICRISDVPHDYTSGIEFAREGGLPELIEARRRAETMGLIRKGL